MSGTIPKNFLRRLPWDTLNTVFASEKFLRNINIIFLHMKIKFFQVLQQFRDKSSFFNYFDWLRNCLRRSFPSAILLFLCFKKTFALLFFLVWWLCVSTDRFIGFKKLLNRSKKFVRKISLKLLLCIFFDWLINY